MANPPKENALTEVDPVAANQSTTSAIPLLVAPPAVICVFCGASPGTSELHLAAARELAHVLHANNINLVYGGGTTGLMGEVARTMVSLSGPDSVHGIIPSPLVKYERKASFGDVTNITSNNTSQKHGSVGAYGKVTQVEDMHTRKKMMAQEVMTGGPGSGFIALTGGFGTMEELMEVVTWNQLGIHDKGVVAFNVEGYFDGMIEWVKRGVTTGFITQNYSEILVEAKNAEDAVKALRDYKVKVPQALSISISCLTPQQG